MPITIILPTLNEAQNIGKLIDKIENIFKKNKYDGKIIIVDDMSEDDTSGICKQFNKKYKNIIVIDRNIRDGFGKALQRGYEETEDDILISMEADNSCDPNDIPKIVNKLNAGYDIVIASRYMKKSLTNKSIINTIISRVGNKFISFLTGIVITDFTIAYRGVRKNITNIVKCNEKDANPFLVEFIIRAHRKGFKKITEIPTHYKDREFGVTKNKLIKAIPKTFLAVIKITIFRR